MLTGQLMLALGCGIQILPSSNSFSAVTVLCVLDEKQILMATLLGRTYKNGLKKKQHSKFLPVTLNLA